MFKTSAGVGQIIPEAGVAKRPAQDLRKTCAKHSRIDVAAAKNKYQRRYRRVARELMSSAALVVVSVFSRAGH